MKTLTDQLRKTIQASPDTIYRIAKNAEISAAMLSRFVSGERDLRLATVDKIIAALGVQVTLGESKGRK